jgi:hypothetical protein
MDSSIDISRCKAAISFSFFNQLTEFTLYHLGMEIWNMRVQNHFPLLPFLSSAVTVGSSSRTSTATTTAISSTTNLKQVDEAWKVKTAACWSPVQHVGPAQNQKLVRRRRLLHPSTWGMDTRQPVAC